jgi:hypothetical protein
MTVAADPDPYFALPKLYGAPAYARPPKVVPEGERPLDPDDLPIAALQTEDERALTQVLQASGTYLSGAVLGSTGVPHGAVAVAPGSDGAFGGNGHRGEGSGVSGRRFSLRALTDRLGPRPR